MLKFKFPNELVLEWMGDNSIPRGRIISSLKPCKIISKGCHYHIMGVKDFESDIPPIKLVPSVKDFLEVFHDDFPRIPLEWK